MKALIIIPYITSMSIQSEKRKNCRTFRLNTVTGAVIQVQVLLKKGKLFF